MTASKITIVCAIVASLMANPIMNVGNSNVQSINTFGGDRFGFGVPASRGRIFGRRDSVNNDGVFDNVHTVNSVLSALNRPKVDKHIDSDASSSNTAGSATNSLKRRDSVNNDGVFSNVHTANDILKILNRPKVDKHIDSDASSSNTAGSATNSLKRRDRVNNNGVFGNVDTASGFLKILSRPNVDKHTDSDASSSNTAGSTTNSLRRRDSVNNDGVFSNVHTSDDILKILNRPKVDKHIDSDASSSNTAGSATNSLKRRDRVNNDGVFSNVDTTNGLLKILNRPNVDKHRDSDASSSNTAGSSHGEQFSRRSTPDDITQNWFNQANSFKVLNHPTVSKPVGATAAGNNEAGGIINNGLRRRDSVNNDGVFSNIFTNSAVNKILNRPNIDKHTDSDARHTNTAGSATNSEQFVRRDFQGMGSGGQTQISGNSVQTMGGGAFVPGAFAFGWPAVGSTNIRSESIIN
jgi:hypothetical protein